MKRFLMTFMLASTMTYAARLEGITYTLRERWRIWWLAWQTAGEEEA